MFTKLPFIALALSTLVAAVPWATPPTQCTTEQQLCCNDVSDASHPSLQSLLGAVGIPIASITGQVGASCVPITGIGTGSGADCSTQPVCCTDNNYNGIVALGCNPVDADA